MIKDAIGPYIGWFFVTALYGWPFVVFHGTARLAIGIPWLVVTLGITVLAIISKRRRP